VKEGKGEYEGNYSPQNLLILLLPLPLPRTLLLSLLPLPFPQILLILLLLHPI
jgi:hypothetical protein